MKKRIMAMFLAILMIGSLLPVGVYAEEEAEHEHDYTAEVTAPTCTEGGYTVYTCDCGESYVADEMAALGHALEKVEALDPTCTEAGNIEFWRCTVCGACFADEAGTVQIAEEDTVIPPTGEPEPEEIAEGPEEQENPEISAEPEHEIPEEAPAEAEAELMGLPGASLLSAGDPIASGECGEKLTWELSEDGVLTITGEGAMTNYSDSVPWDSYLSSVKEVIIESSVTSIGEYVFSDCSGLTSVTIPASVTSIGNGAFSGCSGLTSVTIPDGVTSIGSCAFEGCSGLTSVTIPDGVTSIGDGAFDGCSGLTDNEGFVIVKGILFDYCGYEDNIILPDSVTSIGASAFEDCSGLTSVTLPDSVTTIGVYAFWGCSRLTSVTIPDSVTSIGASAFGGCSGLTSVTLPASVTEIGPSVFAWSGIKTITFLGDLPTSMNGNAFCGLQKVTVYYPAGNPSYTGKMNDYGGSDITWVGTASGTCGTNLTWELVGSALTITGSGEMTDYMNDAFDPEMLPAPWQDFCDEIRTIALPDGLTSIGSAAFYECSALESITIPAHVTKIGMDVFQSSGIKAITFLGDLPENMNDNAFYGLDGVTVYYPLNNETYVSYWPAKDNRLDYGGTDITWVGRASGTCGDNLTWELTGITLTISGSGEMDPGSHIPWEDYEYYVESVVIESGVTSICDEAFSYVYDLTTVRIPDTVTSIGSQAFYSCENLKTVTLPANLTTIGGFAFYGCESLTSVTLPANLTTIGESAFYDCVNLKSLVIPEGVKTIGVNAFLNCPKLNVTIPHSVETIGEYAFFNCGTVRYSGTLTELKAIMNGKDPGDTIVCSDGVHVLSGTCGANLTWELDAGVLTITGSGDMTDYQNSAVSSTDLAPWDSRKEEIRTVRLPDGLTSIGDHAFKECISLSEIKIPAGVTRIGEQAIYGCWELASIELPESVVSIGPGAFAWCIGLKAVKLNGIAPVSEEMFANCTDLESIEIPAGTASIGRAAFYNCVSLKNVFFTGDMPSVDGEAFMDVEDVTMYYPAGNESYTDENMKDYGGTGIVWKSDAGLQNNSYTIVFDANVPAGSSATGSMDDVNMAWGQSVSLPANAFNRTGYTFTGWNTKADGSGDSYADMASVKNLTSVDGATVTLYARWTANAYPITYNLNGGVNTEANPTTYTVEDGEIVLQDPVREGYTFKGWYTNKKLTKRIYSIAAGSTDNVTVYAKWSVNKYKISFSKNGGTSGKMAKVSTTYGKTVKLKANAFKRKGYTFTGWNTMPDGSGTAFKNKAKVKNLSATGGTVTLYAQWRIKTYKITYKLKGGTNSEGNPTTYTVESGKITLQKPTRTGYTFKGWYSDSKMTKRVSSFKARSTGNKTLYAKWSVNKYKIVFNRNGATSGSMKTKTISYGKTATLTANAFKRKGYTFIGWNTAPDGSGTYYSNKAKVKNLTTVTSEKIMLYAQWSLNNYGINYNLNGGTNDPDNPGEYTVANDTIVLKDPVREGYSFVGWYSNSKMTKRVYSIAAGSTGTKTLYAKWAACNYSIRFDGNGANPGYSMNSVSTSYGRTVTLAANVFRRDGYTFAGWSTDATGAGGIYADRAGVSNLTTGNGDVVTLYAQWTANTYTIVFDGNGASSGSMENLSATYDVSCTLTANAFKKTSCRFIEWNTAADGSGTSYGNKASVKNLKELSGTSITLYAQWEETVDTDAPQVTGISLSATSVEAPGTLTVTMAAWDEISEMKSGSIYFRNAETGGNLSCTLNRDSEGTLTGIVTVGQNADPGEYLLNYVLVKDSENNIGEYYGNGFPDFSEAEPDTQLPAALAAISFTVE